MLQIEEGPNSPKSDDKTEDMPIALASEPEPEPDYDKRQKWIECTTCGKWRKVTSLLLAR
jgi:uncharacterized protein YifN (PemK superfamily)